MLPGAAFGMPEEKYLARLAFVDFDGAKALDALGEQAGSIPVDTAFLKAYCPKVVQATDEICDWLR